eukprot:12845145-Prorocentrum_lima.AAC.1
MHHEPWVGDSAVLSRKLAIIKESQTHRYGVSSVRPCGFHPSLVSVSSTHIDDITGGAIELEQK